MCQRFSYDPIAHFSTPLTWDANAHRLVRGKQTLWQLVCQRDSTFPDRLQNRVERPSVPADELVRSLFNCKLVFPARNNHRLRTRWCASSGAPPN